MLYDVLVTHDDCADGLASAMIVADACPGIEVVFAQHNTPSLTELEPRPRMLFCDIAPPRERAHLFVEAGATVLDHHRHARDIVELFGERGVFADEELEPGVSGALLAYREVWRPMRAKNLHARVDAWHPERAKEIHFFAQLVAIRDTWQRESAQWVNACALHSLLMAIPRDYWVGHLYRVFDSDMEELGGILYKNRLAQVDKLIRDGAFKLLDEDGGSRRRWALFPDSNHLVSDVAEKLRELRIADVVCGWWQTMNDGELSTVLSLRSNGSLDVGALAKRFGGGGHTRAAGCAVKALDSMLAAESLFWAAQGRSGVLATKPG